MDTRSRVRDFIKNFVSDNLRRVQAKNYVSIESDTAILVNHFLEITAMVNDSNVPGKSIPDFTLNRTKQLNCYDVAFLVLPTGHGKSHLHDPERRIFESDSLMYCRGSITLSILRDDAKLTGSWDLYDTCFAAEIALRIPNGRVLLLLPSKSLGEQMGAHYLGTMVLEWDVWVENLKSRGQTPVNYVQDYQIACIEAATIKDNATMMEEVRTIADGWVKDGIPQYINPDDEESWDHGDDNYPYDDEADTNLDD